MDKYKVTILEDEQIISMHLQQLLEDGGYDVQNVYNSGEELLGEIESNKPDIMFVDVMLAGELTGIETVNKIQNRDDICLIYLTSNSNDSVIDEAKKTLPSAFLKKPFNANQLKATLDVTLHTFIERNKQSKKLNKQNDMNQMQIEELMETQQHLITATWRERELKEELQATKKLIEEQNRKIMDSINYAKRIQKAIIPQHVDLENALGDYFMYYKPKDAVSGDFPWLYERGDYTYIAAVDCTGHGVPGAMMSLIGHLLLNDIVNNTEEYKTPGEILNELHHAVVSTLKQDAPGNKAADGMDVAICRINKDRSEVLYAGAHRPLYKLHEGAEEVIQYKGSKFPIGGMQYAGQNTFEDQKVEVQSGDQLFFFSDGLPDQFGGPNNRKLGPKRIRRLIEENKGKSMTEFNELFENHFMGWMGDQKQMDDVLLIGINF